MLIKTQVNLMIPVAYLLLTAYVLVVPFFETPYELFASLLVLLSALPIYLIFVAWKNKPRSLYQGWGGKLINCC